jgi:hypothetical protein
MPPIGFAKAGDGEGMSLITVGGCTSAIAKSYCARWAVRSILADNDLIY